MILQKAASNILVNVAAVSKSGGAVQVIQINDGGKIIKVPAVPGIGSRSSQKDAYIDMLPNSKESAVAFWQVFSTRVDQKRGIAGKTIPMIAAARLVVWGNKTRLNPPDINALLGECIRETIKSDLSEPWIQSVLVTLDGYEPRNKAVFSEYTIDEAETQYLTEPYDFASALLSFNYTIMLECLPDVSAVEPAL